MPHETPKTQQLSVSNISVRIGEAMQARTKDPLWFLARQWQTGEFSAENGGKPAYLSISFRDYPLESVTFGDGSTLLDLDEPLEFIVEREDVNGESAAWREEALEYEFGANTAGHRLHAEDYAGHRLDWYHFDYIGSRTAPAKEIESCRMTPTQVHLRGAPHPRWWRLEDHDSYFDSPDDPEPNALSLLLPEFFYVDINNWYVAPVAARAGVMRVMENVMVVDSFGVTTKIPAVDGGGENGRPWRVFTLELAPESDAAPLDARHLFLPNVALEVLHNDDIEDIRFLRDEEANLVWAFEHRYRAPDGTAVVNGDRTLAPSVAAAVPSDGLPRFVLRSDVAPHWIPYVARYVRSESATNSETYLRRGRTVESATPTSPQYGSRIVAESWRINEEQVPRSGIRVRRTACFARGSNGVGLHWVGRYRETGRRMTPPELQCDFIEPPAGPE
jgi:hypothetical protein